jgi:hypothetical protein
MLVKILVWAPYSDYGGPFGNRRAKIRQVGEIVEFPDNYAQMLLETNMVEVYGDDGVVIDLVDEINATTPAVDFAYENRFDLTHAEGTGGGGRITLADARRYKESLDASDTEA